MSEVANTHGFRMPHGKHRGELLTRVPVSYLRWISNERGHSLQAMAKAELDRRGTTMPTLEISGHAIDRASLNCRKVWHSTANEGEGLHAWLMRMGGEARERGRPCDSDEPGSTRFDYAGLRWVFVEGEEFPVLKTVMPR